MISNIVSNEEKKIEVLLLVDIEKRRLHTRIHSAGHAIDSGIERLGYSDRLIPLKGYHFIDGPYVEYQLLNNNIEINEKEIKQLEINLQNSLNQIIDEDIKTTITIKSAPNSLDGFIRTVNLANSICPCGGTHVRTTKELNKIVISKIKKKKDIIKISYIVE